MLTRSASTLGGLLQRATSTHRRGTRACAGGVVNSSHFVSGHSLIIGPSQEPACSAQIIQQAGSIVFQDLGLSNTIPTQLKGGVGVLDLDLREFSTRTTPAVCMRAPDVAHLQGFL
jgi:hypothetical protein